MEAFAFVRLKPRRCRRANAMCMVALVSLALGGACSAPRDDTAANAPADTTSAIAGATTVAVPPGDSARVSHSRAEDLTGDSRAEQLTLEARGPRMDSLDIRLAIRSPADSVLYHSGWSSRAYFEYIARASMSDSAADTLVRRQLGRVLGDTSFGTVGAGGYIAPGSTRPPGDTSLVDMMRDAIRHDIATSDWRRSNGVPLDAPTPASAYEPISAAAKSVPAARIQAIIEELRGRPAFNYSVGGEATYAIAWSDREQRFITIFACC